MKITIDIQMPTREQAQAVKRKVPLEERVDYAVHQIIANTPSKNRAIVFLREAFHYLDGLHTPTEKTQALKEEIKSALGDYGIYHKGSSQKE